MKDSKIKEKIVKMYIIIIVTIMPFYYENGYLNMTYAKAKFAWIVGGMLLILFLVLSLSHTKKYIKYYKRECGMSNRKKLGLSLIDISIFLFWVSVWCSVIFGIDPYLAFWGNAGWYMGAFTLTILVLSYFVISRNIKWDIAMSLVAFVSVIVICFNGVLFSFHIDLFHLHQGIKNSFYDYITTIGNVNWYVGLLSMVFPMSCLAYMGIKKRFFRVGFCLYLDLVFYNMIVCKSNGIFLSLIAVLFVIVLYLMEYKEHYCRVKILLLNLCSVCGLVWGIQTYYQGEYISLDSMFQYIITKKIWLYIEVGIIGYMILVKSICRYGKERKLIVFNKRSKSDKENSCKFACYLIMLIGVGALLLYETSSFGDTWGSQRGELWICTIHMFMMGKLKYQIWGCGCDCFGVIFMKFYENYADIPCLNAHNEFLQYLVTTGIVGVISFCLIWISVIYTFYNHQTHSNKEWILFSGLMGYLGQMIVNNPQALNYAILFLLLALYNNEIEKRI